MDSSVLDEEWELLASFLPAGWEQLARGAKAIRHEKGITEPALLLRLLLLHVGGGLSLRQATARGGELGLPAISDVALLKRLRTSEEWLRQMAERMYATSRFGTRQRGALGQRRLLAVDATTVEEPGATGTSWRVHYSIELPRMACDFYQLTDDHGGESYKRFPVSPGDVILGDRGYSHREGVAHVLRAHGDVVVRLNSTAFPLLDANGRPFALLPHLRQMHARHAKGWGVRFDADKERFRARLCAVRKSAAAAEKAKERARRDAAKKDHQIQPETLECAEYVFVLTTLGAEFSPSAVLELYRARWQIELVFKRLKSLLQLGHLPKYSDESACAWIEGKLLVVLLIEKLADHACFLSPWGFDLLAEPLA